MNILVLGGTIFLGRHLVDAALERGHSVTLFHRGQHASEHDTRVEHIYGDRWIDLQRLQGRTWDAVIDTSGYVPAVVRASAQQLADGIGQYVFISSVSAYADVSVVGVDENAPLCTLTPEQLSEVERIVPPAQGVPARAYGEMYGGLKALCEKVVEECLPTRALIIRPGLIVGPYDYSDRFTYWAVRAARGGEALAPDRPACAVQLIDARDLASWIMHLLETRQMGIYNATGPAQTLTMGEVLAACQSVGKSNVSYTWVDEAFLLSHNVQPWSQLPLWLPDTPEYAGFHAISIARALKVGLTFRPLVETARDTLNWARTLPEGHEWQAGLASADETHLLRAWHEQRLSQK